MTADLPSEVMPELHRLIAGRQTLLASDLGNFLLSAASKVGSPVKMRDLGGAAAFVGTYMPDWEPDPDSPKGVRYGFRMKRERIQAADAPKTASAMQDGFSLWSALTNPSIAAGREVVWSASTSNWFWRVSDSQVSTSEFVLPRLHTADYAQFVEDFIKEREATLAGVAAADLRASVLLQNASMGGRLFRATLKHGLVKTWEAYRTTRVMDRLRALISRVEGAPVEEILQAAQHSRTMRGRNGVGTAKAVEAAKAAAISKGSPSVDAKAVLTMLLPYLSDFDLGGVRVPVDAVARMLSDLRELPNNKVG